MQNDSMMKPASQSILGGSFSKAIPPPRPLTLTAWEKYMLADDKPLWPMTCHIRFWLSGPPERRRLEKALSMMLDLHPLLRAKPMLDETSAERGQARHWVMVTKPHLQWFTSAVALDGISQTENHPPSQWIMQSTPHETILIVRFHHAVADGIGIFAAFEDLLCIYNQGDATQKPTQERSLTDQSTNLHLRSLSPSRHPLRQFFWNMQRILPFMLRLPRVACPWNLRTREPQQAPRWTTVRHLGTSQWANDLALTAKRNGCTVNDLMVAAMFEALAATAPNNTGWWRVAVPISMRTDAHEGMSASNCVSMVFLDRKKISGWTPAGLIRSIHEELAHVKRRKTGDALHFVMRWLTRFPGLVQLLLGSGFSQCSAVLTNLGRPFANSNGRDPSSASNDKLVARDFVLESLDTIPPLRRGTTLALSVNTYAGTPSYTLHYDDRVIGWESAQKFLKTWEDFLKAHTHDSRAEFNR